MIRAAALSALVAGFAPAAHAGNVVTHIDCGNCVAWNAPQKPFRIVGNTYYVGTRELSALLIASPQGLVLLDGALPQSAGQIAQNIASLGFNIKDVKYILNSHAHWDHAGAIGALQAASGATVAASQPNIDVLKAGVMGPDDPQYVAGENKFMTPVTTNLHVVRDGDTLHVGPIAVTAHLTPGHAPGSTTWTWQSCEAGKCYDVVYADSLNAVSQGDFRYSGGAGYPDISASFRQSIDKVAALKCDVIVSVHPGFTDTLDKLAATTPAHNAFITPDGCRKYAAMSARVLDKKLASERGQPAKQ